MVASVLESSPFSRAASLARILLVDDDVTSRLTLQTILRAGGYTVDQSVSASEAVAMLDDNQYDLVLSNLQAESPEAGLRVLAHAKAKEYYPATAIVTAYRDGDKLPPDPSQVLVETVGIASLLAHVADLIGLRARRRVARQMRHPAASIA